MPNLTKEQLEQIFKEEPEVDPSLPQPNYNKSAASFTLTCRTDWRRVVESMGFSYYYRRTVTSSTLSLMHRERGYELEYEMEFPEDAPAEYHENEQDIWELLDAIYDKLTLIASSTSTDEYEEMMGNLETALDQREIDRQKALGIYVEPEPKKPGFDIKTLLMDDDDE